MDTRIDGTRSKVKYLINALHAFHRFNRRYQVKKLAYDHLQNQVLKKLKIKSVAQSTQWSHNGQLDFSNWLADGTG